MKLAIMQPYFFPYIGYFQLIKAVDEFVIYDNIQYTKKGWINRNRILVNGKDEYISLPIKKDSDYLNVCDRFLADSWEDDRKKMLNKIKEAYRKAPYFEPVFTLTEKIMLTEERNLFKFIYNSIINIKEYCEINTKFCISSTLKIDESLKAEKKVLAICKERSTTQYINPIGGMDLYDKEMFKENGITLNFIKTTDVKYTQFNNSFIPMLSILDVMMFNSKEEIQNHLDFGYTLL